MLADDKNYEKVEIDIEVEKIMIVVKRMKQEYQEVILLRFVEELTTSEISSILDKSKTNVRVTLHRATKKLQELLEQD